MTPLAPDDALTLDESHLRANRSTTTLCLPAVRELDGVFLQITPIASSPDVGTRRGPYGRHESRDRFRRHSAAARLSQACRAFRVTG